jgi:hypothetical protein
MLRLKSLKKPIVLTMKVLLDEQLAPRLLPLFMDCDVFSVRDLGWSGLKNGELREQLNNAEFDILVTADKNLPFQQNLSKVLFSIFLLDTPTLFKEDQLQFIPKLNEFIQNPPNPMPKIVVFSVENLSKGLGKKEIELIKLAGNENVLFY